jgi:hypothetical protein
LYRFPFLISHSYLNDVDDFRLFPLSDSPSITVDLTKALNALLGGGGVSLPAKTRDERRDGAKAIATTVSQLAKRGTSAPGKSPDTSIGDKGPQQGERPNLRRPRRFMRKISCKFRKT